AGQVVFDGKDITGLRPDQVCQAGLARTFQVVRPFKDISVFDNVMVGAYNRTSRERTARDKAEQVIDFLGMTSIARQSAGGLPVATRKRLEIARALATEPKIILLDEAMSGLRPTEMDETIAMVRRVSQTGVALLLVEHVMKVIMSLAARIVVVHHGEKLAEGKPDEIVRNQAVIDAYLGEVKTSAASRES
ncbi:MAG: ATP-binding cassette domain-containing protein, partial [Chloroflexi bacterium]|nr:ATP-binding cassette domain-containing protein [Chloroflexota bacterium]